MKYFNNVGIRVFSYKEEFEEVKEGFLELLNHSEEELEKEKIEITYSEAIGFNEEKIWIISTYFEKNRQCNSFMEWLKENISMNELKPILESGDRIDEDGDLYLRLDKKSLLKREFKLTETGDCYHIRANIAAFPKKKEKAKEIIENYFL